MANCSVKFPVGTSAAELSTSMSTYIKSIGTLAESMVSFAAKEFFEETTRWRYVSHKIELQCGDQQIDFDLPEGVRCRARAPIFQQYTRCPHRECDEIKVYERKDGAQSDMDNVAYQDCEKPLAFYQPENGKVIFSHPMTEDCTFRVELILWPSTFEAIDCVPDEIMSTYREGILSLAIVKAMEIPDKPWTTPKDGYSPNLFEAKHLAKVAKHKRSAKRYHINNVSEGRPFGDRFQSKISSNGRRDHRGHYRNRLHRW